MRHDPLTSGPVFLKQVTTLSMLQFDKLASEEIELAVSNLPSRESLPKDNRSDLVNQPFRFIEYNRSKHQCSRTVRYFRAKKIIHQHGRERMRSFGVCFGVKERLVKMHRSCFKPRSRPTIA